MATKKLGLPTITGNMTADVVRDLNALANKIDDLFGVDGGFAPMDGDGAEIDMSNIVTKGELHAHLDDALPHDDGYEFTATDIDDRGVYRVITYTRPNGTTYMTSTLSNADTNGNYQTCTWRFYNSAGASVTTTKIWTLTYDNYRNIIKVVVV